MREEKDETTTSTPVEEVRFDPEHGGTLSEALDLYRQEYGHVRYLSLRECGDEGVQRLAEIAKQGGSDVCLESLDLSDSGLTSVSSASLVSLIQSNKETLREVNLGNAVRDDGLDSLVGALGDIERLVRLNLYGNMLRDKGLKKLESVFRKHHSLQEVHLGNNALRGKAGNVIFQGCQRNDQLRVLDLSENQLNNACVKVLAGLLNQRKSVCRLQELDLSKQKGQLTGVGASHLQRELIEGNNTDLSILNLSHNSLGVKGGEALGNLLQKSHTLKVLRLAGCNLGEAKKEKEAVMPDAGLWSLCRGLANASKSEVVEPALVYLDLSHNTLHPDSGPYLAHLLQFSTTLRVLKLKNNALGDQGIKHIAQAIPLSSCIVELDVRENIIGDDGAVALAESFKQCRVDFHLQWHLNTHMTDYGLSRMDGAERLRQSRLDWLDQETEKLKNCLSGTCFTRSDLWDDELIDICDAIASTAPRSYNLVVCQLEGAVGGTKLTQRGIEAVSSQLICGPHVTLKNLNILHTRMGDGGAALLAEALMGNSPLTNLRCTDCDLTDDAAVSFSRAFSRNSGLALLELCQNRIGVDGAKALLNAVKNAPILHSLILGANEIGDFSPDSLSSVGHLRTLNLSMNRITDNGAAELARLLGNTLAASKRTLKALDVSQNSLTQRGMQLLNVVCKSHSISLKK